MKSLSIFILLATFTLLFGGFFEGLVMFLIIYYIIKGVKHMIGL